MKKIKYVLAFLMMLGVMTSECSVAQAAEEHVEIVSVGNRSIEALSEEEKIVLQQEIARESIGEEADFPLTASASYEPFSYSESFNIYIDGGWVARADAECIVWHYTDGKVHLYRRTITVTRLATYDAGRTYGRIVNTDGSLSYTTGDRIHLYGLTNTWDFAIDFRVTPTDAAFNCYEV